MERSRVLTAAGLSVGRDTKCWTLEFSKVDMYSRLLEIRLLRELWIMKSLTALVLNDQEKRG